MRMNRVMRGLLFVLAGVAFVAVGAAVVMFLWNALVPSIFGLRAIGFWQALGLLVLSRILFGRLRGGARWHWRHRMHERWASMSPEERAKFQEGMRGRCGAFAQAAPRHDAAVGTGHPNV